MIALGWPLLISIGLLLLALLLLIGLTLLRSKIPTALHKIEAYDRLTRSVGLAVENGTRLHISLGRGSLFTTRGASALAGLAMLHKLTQRTSLSDRPPVVTTGDASLAILSQDTLQSGYRAAGAEDQYRYSTGRLTGLTPFAYAAGARTGSRYRQMPASGQAKIDSLLPRMLTVVAAHDYPDAPRKPCLT